jgi:serine/threonine protein kinase
VNCPHCNVANPDEARFCAACGKATSATEPVSYPHLKAPLELVGKEIAGRYRLLSKLGEGGMGAVYKAEQISLKRACAVKLLKADVASTELMLRRFDAEAKAVAALSHPNTVNIYDFGQDTDGTFFIAMEFVEGRSLRDVIHTESPLPIRRALAIASQVASSLADAHSHNIIHRDLKPDNVMLSVRGRQKDVVRVLDFGIAKLRDEGRATQAAMTQAGDMLGTPQYMAPEQIRAEQIDGRTDVYALGCILYEMLTGRMPFEGATVLAILSKHLTETPVAPSQRRTDLQIPPHIDQLVMAAVAKDPNARPATMELFGEQLNALLAQFPAETGQGTAQVSTPMSAVHQVVGPTMATGPGPAFAAPAAYPPAPAYAPPTPPPPGPAPGYGTPQPQPSPQYSPYPTPPPPPPVAAAPGGKGKLLIAAIGAIVLIGGGIGIFVATRKTDQPVVATADAGESPDKPEKPDEPDKPDKPETPPEKPTKPDDPDEPDKPETPPDKPTKPDDPDEPDPWDIDPGTSGGDINAQAIAKVTGFKNAICACTTMQCAAGPSSEFGKWAAAIGPKLGQLDRNATATLTKLGNEIAECTKRIVAASQPKADPVKEVEALAVKACSCNDAACGRRVLDEMLGWARKWKDKDEKDVDQERISSASGRIGQCLINAGVTQQDIVVVVQQIQNM